VDKAESRCSGHSDSDDSKRPDHHESESDLEFDPDGKKELKALKQLEEDIGKEADLDPTKDPKAGIPSKTTFFNKTLGILSVNRAPAKGEKSWCYFCKDETLEDHQSEILHNSLRFEYSFAAGKPHAKIHGECYSKVPKSHWEVSLGNIEKHHRPSVSGIVLDPSLNELLDQAANFFRENL
jgi:hypothetical protein